ncbi:PqiB family protein [Trichlorobacter lovleyi]|uniref:Mammalian cell entry related domain protein n=1 Tax=Trichlorobacter lovleyi (strain ATCC BAA-1151 / DSM 17278 / SZ) TaxID=398767 RepID=B3EAR5_TRIL1|nr:MlaD family protein [Trichlorobacter lovleyi]ACD96948.1 Mammalian cell entry related domain protein [Trichlorobacter lovleyi SZ]
MSETVTNPGSAQTADIPEAIVDRRRHRSSQLIWLIPVVALIIGLSLGIKAYLEKGPTITISFKSGEGIEEGKTKIKYKDVQIGLVRDVSISSDRSSVVVTAEIERDAAEFMKADTRFWVVRARITGSSITGLGTLTGGTYIGMDVGSSQEDKTAFTGLETPPVVTMDVPGRQFVLHADDLGSLNVGSPIFYRHLQVGEVVSNELDQDGETILLRIFVRAPYDKYVRQNTRFWHASGIDFSLDANGVKINTESLLSVMMGGIAFQTPEDFEEYQQAEQNRHFTLFENREVAIKSPDSTVENYRLLFSESVRGLTVGAPVDLRGITVGEVTKIKAEIDPASKKVIMAVQIRFYPERVKPRSGATSDQRATVDSRKLLDAMVKQGFRAQLKSGNLLTGQLYVALDFFPGVPTARIDWHGNPPVLPTVSGNMAQLQASLTQIVQKLERLPLEELAGDARKTVQTLDTTLKSADKLLKNIDTSVVPETRLMMEDVRKTLDGANKALAEVKQTMSADAPLQVDLRDTLRELGRAAQSLRVLGDYLERNPEALLRGKKEDQR